MKSLEGFGTLTSFQKNGNKEIGLNDSNSHRGFEKFSGHFWLEQVKSQGYACCCTADGIATKDGGKEDISIPVFRCFFRQDQKVFDLTVAE